MQNVIFAISADVQDVESDVVNQLSDELQMNPAVCPLPSEQQRSYWPVPSYCFTFAFYSLSSVSD